MSNHKEIFTSIYDNNIWGGSGGGSMPSVTVEYRLLIDKFIDNYKIKTIIDFACGDWQFSNLIDWSCVHYLGVDCVQSVIDENIKKYESKNVRFMCAEDINIGADLLILKDVLQHWTNEDVISFLDKAIMLFKYILITNSSDQQKDWEDSSMPHIQTRYLSVKYLPLKKYNPKILLETNINEKKETSLIITNIYL